MHARRFERVDGSTVPVECIPVINALPKSRASNRLFFPLPNFSGPRRRLSTNYLVQRTRVKGRNSSQTDQPYELLARIDDTDENRESCNELRNRVIRPPLCIGFDLFWPPSACILRETDTFVSISTYPCAKRAANLFSSVSTLTVMQVGCEKGGHRREVGTMIVGGRGIYNAWPCLLPPAPRERFPLSSTTTATVVSLTPPGADRNNAK